MNVYAFPKQLKDYALQPNAYDMKYYITTPLYYVNDQPHIGHAYTTIAADAIARYKRLKGIDVFFLTGTDEHGQKIEREAQKRGIPAQALANQMMEKYKSLWQLLSISYTDFIRTTDDRHKKAATHLFTILYDKGDIYKGRYEGPYCTPCETFVKERICPDCGRPCEIISEETYFFRLSKYRDQLLSYIQENPNFILPSYRKNEMINLIGEELIDLSITRSTFSWGIPVPIAGQKDVMYVWFEALVNYLTGVGYPDDKEVFERYWPADLHLVGKDILRFHTIIWPVMLIASGLTPPKRVFGHGWWTINEEKMSKSKGNVIDPFEIIDEFGADGFRYFLLREIAFGLDGDFSRKALIHRLNSDLANDLGNLLGRVMKMVVTYTGGMVPERADGEHLRDIALNIVSEIEAEISEIRFQGYLEKVWALVRSANKYVDQKKPWTLKGDSLNPVLYNLLESIRMLSIFLFPIIPNLSVKMANCLGLDEKDLSLIDLKWGGLSPGTRIKYSAPLFMRIA